MPSNILTVNDEIFNYIDDVNYGMTNSQINHLATIMHGLINVSGNKSISSIGKAIANSKDKSCMYKFLSSSDFDENVLNSNRINHITQSLESVISSGSVGFISIDDTINKKSINTRSMDGLGYHYSHTEGKSVLSHCVVTSNFSVGDISIPIDFESYYKEDYCRTFKKEFKSKIDIAKEFIQDFKQPSKCDKIYVLTDSWYTSSPIIRETLNQGYQFIGAIKSNRIIYSNGMKMQISEFAKTINPYSLDVVTVKGKDYRVYLYKGNVNNFDNISIAICYEVDGCKLKEPFYIITSDLDIDEKTIIEYYAIRWTIETNYKYLKSNLGFDKYRVRSLISIERYFLIVFLSIDFLELFRVTKSVLESIGETIKYQENLSFKALVDYIYCKAKGNTCIEDIYKTLNIAC